MKRIVFTEFFEMVEDKFSSDIADRLIEECELPSGGIYTAVSTYDNQEIVSMVVPLSEISGILIEIQSTRTFALSSGAQIKA